MLTVPIRMTCMASSVKEGIIDEVLCSVHIRFYYVCKNVFFIVDVNSRYVLLQLYSFLFRCLVITYALQLTAHEFESQSASMLKKGIK